MSNPTLAEYRRQATERLTQAGGASPVLDARLLIQAAAGLSDADMIAHSERQMDEKALALADSYIARREQGEPVAKILGEKEFWGRVFHVNSDTLDPRPDTEILIEQALNWARAQDRPLRILDLGTGTGCIIITLLAELPDAIGVTVDISDKALSVARKNAARHGVIDRLYLRQGSWFAPIDAAERFDLIVSNPPYIPDADIETLARDVRAYDPILALAGGIDGLDPYKIVFPDLCHHLSTGGKAFFEMGIGQGAALARLVDDSHATLDAIYKDLAGIERVLAISVGKR